MTDSIVSYLNYIFYQRAREKPDSMHPFGHGGFEIISSLLQGVLISVLAVVLAYDCINALLDPKAQHLATKTIPIAMGVMFVSALTGYGLQFYLGLHERRLQLNRERSLALSSDRAHYKSDFYTNALGAIGLFSVWWWESYTLDRILGLVGAGFLVYTAYPLLKSSLEHIMQTGADPMIQKEITDVILDTDDHILGFHLLRTRYHGPALYIDFHLKLPAHLNLHDAHALSEKVESRLRAVFPQADILIHLDPDDSPDEPDFN